MPRCLCECSNGPDQWQLLCECLTTVQMASLLNITILFFCKECLQRFQEPAFNFVGSQYRCSTVLHCQAQTNEKEVNENHDRNIINLKLTIKTNSIINMDGIRTLSHPWPLFGKRFTLWARCDIKTLPFGFVVKHYLELILQSFALENLFTASWALVDDPIRVNKIKRNFL